MTSSSRVRPRNCWSKKSCLSFKQFMAERGLELSPEKTRITHIEDGFDFLGQNVRKYKGKLLIKPSKKNQHAFLTKVREIIKANKSATAGNLITQLNPLISGWANYHQHVASKRTFSDVDTAIFKALWRWAKRRHPNKNAKWIRRKYFRYMRALVTGFSRAWSKDKEGKSHKWSGSSKRPRPQSDVTSKSKGKQIPTTPRGKSTLSNDWE